MPGGRVIRTGELKDVTPTIQALPIAHRVTESTQLLS
jgi:hypothetical protein